MALVAPLAILLAGALVAMGGGVGGVGSLGQLSSGPDLPRTGVPDLPHPSAALADPEALAVGGGSATASRRGGARSASGTAPQRAAEATVPRAPRTPAGAQPAPPSAVPPSAGSPAPSESESRRGPPGEGADSGPSAAGGDPVAGLVEVTRGVTTPVPPPVSPVAEPVLDGLLGPRGR